MEKEKNNNKRDFLRRPLAFAGTPPEDLKLLFLNSLRERFRRPLLHPSPPVAAPPAPVEQQMGLAEYIAVRHREAR
jgi:hypothetical protein